MHRGTELYKVMNGLSFPALFMFLSKIDESPGAVPVPQGDAAVVM
jgi:hypothetical protein